MSHRATQPAEFFVIAGGAETSVVSGNEPLTSVASFKKPERLTALAQTKLTPSEFERLEKIRDSLNESGVEGVTISSLLRTFAVHGIRVAEEELKSDK